MSALTLPPGRWLSVSERRSGRERKTEREAPKARPPGMSYRQWRRARGLCVECPVKVGIGGPARCTDCKRRERARERAVK